MGSDGEVTPLRSVRRALDVLRAFEVPPHCRGVSELARALDLSKGTIHLLAKVLEREGFLERDPATRKYRLGPAVFRLTAAARPDLRLAAREPLQHLYTDTSFPAYLAILVGGRAVVVEKAAPTLPFLAALDVGTPLPLHSSALGKVLLAGAPAEAREGALSGIEPASLVAMTPSTITSLPVLRGELDSVQAAGLAWDREESLPGVVCLAAPVRGPGGEVLAAVSVAAPAGAVQEGESAGALEGMVRRTAEAISYRVGYRGTGGTDSSPATRPAGSSPATRPAGSARMTRPAGSSPVTRPAGSARMTRPAGTARKATKKGADLGAVSRQGPRQG